MSQTLLPLAGFEVTFNGRFWVTAEGYNIDACLALTANRLYKRLVHPEKDG
jgi:hypothetical protein